MDRDLEIPLKSAEPGATERISADQPASDPQEDRFGYASFARLLAHSVLRGSPAHGLVVGIYGRWGLGKTSLLNFIAHFAQSDVSDDAPVIVRFNPWWFSGREDLIRRFFKELEGATKEASEAVKSQARRRSILEAVRKFSEAASHLPVPGAGAAKAVGSIAQLGLPDNVVELKKSLDAALRSNVLRVLVFIDDIDRLAPQDMLEVFRLVKSVGDLPNVIYVLAFDREIVSAAIDDSYKSGGTRYLEKIIQVSFELPNPSQRALRNMFLGRLGEIFAGTEAALIENDRWRSLYGDGIEPLLKTPRDVTRLLNTIAVTYPPLKGEVNAADFVSIETLRLLVPTVYEAIRTNPDRFVGMSAVIADSMDVHRNEAKSFHESWIASVNNNAKAVKNLVAGIFPHVRSFLTDTSSVRTGRNSNARVSRRISSEEFFEVYFQYSVTADVFSRIRLMRLLSRAADEATALKDLQELAGQRFSNGGTHLRDYIDAIEDELSAKTQLSAEVRKSLIISLSKIGEQASAEAEHSRRLGFLTPEDVNVVLAMRSLLMTFPNAERTNLARAAVEVAGVSFAGRLVIGLGTQHGRYGRYGSKEEEEPPGKRVVEQIEEIERLEELVRAKFFEASKDESFWSIPNIRIALLDWLRVGGKNDMQSAVRAWSASNKHLAAILPRLIPETRHARDDELDHYEINKSFLDEIFVPEELTERLRNLLSFPDLTDQERETAKLVIRAYERGKEGRIPHESES